MSEPKIWGEEDITITIGPTGATKVWAGVRQIGYLQSIRVAVDAELDRVQAEVRFHPPDGIEEQLQEIKTMLANFPQVKIA